MIPAKNQSAMLVLLKLRREGAEPSQDQFVAAIEDIAENGSQDMRDILTRMIETGS